jgi:hypothetical protein
LRTSSRSALAQLLHEFNRPANDGLFDRQRARLDLRDAFAHRHHEPVVVDILVSERIEDLLLGHEPVRAHHLLEHLHLVDGLDARRLIYYPLDLVVDVLRRLGVAADHLDHHRRHDVLPAFAQQAHRAVKIEEAVLESSPLDLVNDFNLRTGQQILNRFLRSSHSINPPFESGYK